MTIITFADLRRAYIKAFAPERPGPVTARAEMQRQINRASVRPNAARNARPVLLSIRHRFAEALAVNRYYAAAEIKPNGDIDIIRIEAEPTLEHVHSGACGHVEFLRRVNQRHRPFGKLETKPLLEALAAWPMAVLKTVASMRHGFLDQETEDMPRGLRPLDDDAVGIVEAVNRCAMNEAGDDDRILLARKSKGGGTMLGPCELVECEKHAGQYELHRWTWDVPSDGDQRCAIESASEPEIVRSCALCIEEENDEVE